MSHENPANKIESPDVQALREKVELLGMTFYTDIPDGWDSLDAPISFDDYKLEEDGLDELIGDTERRVNGQPWGLMPVYDEHGSVYDDIMFVVYKRQSDEAGQVNREADKAESANGMPDWSQHVYKIKVHELTKDDGEMSRIVVIDGGETERSLESTTRSAGEAASKLYAIYGGKSKTDA